jgi:hypothetical protein
MEVTFRMRKMLLTPLVFCIVALLFGLWKPAVDATPPTMVSTLADQTILDTVEMRVAGKNMIVHNYGGGGYLHGSFEGKWIHDEWSVVHLASGKVTLHGVWDTPDGVIFTDVSGAKHSGNLHVQYRGTADLATGVFQGQWVIISGTDDLANLRGQGAIWFDPAIDPVYLHGYLQYHFDP